jgi:hypothetical protein
VRTFCLLLEGSHIEDAFVYRSSLYCWTFDNRLRIYAIKDIEEVARRADPERANSITYGLFHSGGILASQAHWEDRYGLIYSADDTYVSPLMISAESIPHQEPEIRLDAGALLDLLLFYDRLYLGTDGGLFSVDPFDPMEPPRELEVRSRLRDPCYATSGGLGSVAASLGPNGLRIFIDDVHSSSGTGYSRKAALLSVRADVGYGTVVNYRSPGEFDFLAGEVEETPRGKFLTGVQPAETTYSQETAVALREGSDRHVDYAIWHQGRMVTFGGGVIESLSVVISDGSRTVNKRRLLGNYPDDGRVLSASRARHFFAVETDETVIFVDNYVSQQVDTGPVVSMRTYPKSQRYLRLATATTNRGLWMLGAYSGELDE